MIDDTFRIYVEQLRDGDAEQLNEKLSPEFLDINEKELKFFDPVELNGEAYLTDDMLVLHLTIQTVATIPCRICNEPVKVAIDVQGLYSAVPLDEIKSGIYDFRELLRESILVEVPALVECHQGKCPQRQNLEKYFKKDEDGRADEEGYRPFADLE